MAAEENASTLGFFTWAGSAIAKATMALVNDNHLGAFARQGLHELGEATKALPDSIQAHTQGTIFNPYAYDAAKGNHATPSEIAERPASHQPEHGRNHDHGRGRGGHEHGHGRS